MYIWWKIFYEYTLKHGRTGRKRIMDLAKGDKVALVCCSNAQSLSKKKEIMQLKVVLEEVGFIPVFSKYLYQKGDLKEGEMALEKLPEGGTPVEKASEFMGFYEDDSIKAIFDISGGDLANTILPYLDYARIASSKKQFWGYSDLTTVINAIYTKTQKTSVLYQIRNLLYEYSVQQKEDFIQTCFAKKRKDTVKKNSVKKVESYKEYDESVTEETGLYQFPYRFCQGEAVEGIVVGGNIRCFLKLAGTEYFPDVTDKILLLEARSGNVAQIMTYFSQLEQLGAFKKVKGILLGTFTQMEREQQMSGVYSLLKRYIDKTLPVVKTDYIGHGEDSKAIEIGRKYKF